HFSSSVKLKLLKVDRLPIKNKCFNYSRAGRNFLRFLRVLAKPLTTSQQSVEPSNQDCKAEWFGKIIIRAALKPAQDVLWFAACSQHQDRNKLARAAQLGSHFKATKARQHHVEHHGVESIALFQKQRQR